MNTESKHVTLIAPLTGPLVPLSIVPDPVFSQKMVGDGISIDPINSCLTAPCDGSITQVHSACHALTITTSIGIEVMIHIGIETVSLKGEGFDVKVAEGDTVKQGDKLIEFDQQILADKAKSLLTQIIITNGEGVKLQHNEGFVTTGDDFILKLVKEEEEVEGGEEASFPPVASKAIIVPNPLGLHARPSAVLSNSAKKFKSKIELHLGSKSANAKSTVALMKLEVGNGDEVNIIASGSDAAEAVKELTQMLKEGLGEKGLIHQPKAVEATVVKKPKKSSNPNEFLGVSASPGLAVGNILQLKKEVFDIVEEATSSTSEEQAKLNDAIREANTQLTELQNQLIEADSASKAEIFAAHKELLDDPDVLDASAQYIQKGKSAEFAWSKAFNEQADSLSLLKSELLAGRANDLRDVGERVLRILLGLKPKGATEMPENTVLIADDLTPSETATLDTNKMLGFCTIQGGSSSHVAILARAMGIPAVAGMEPQALEIANGTSVIINGNKGAIEINASAEKIANIKDRIKKSEEKRKLDLSNADKPAITVDGNRIEVVANVTGQKEVEASVGSGGEGVGLLRSEILFQDRITAPTEEEQTSAYREMIKTLGSERYMIVRTLDVGGDKPLPYLPIAKEENPFLGERGIRIAIDRPEILRTQLRAILKASTSGDIRVMFPMITVLSDLEMAKKVLEKERLSLGVEPIKVGIMVEVPAVAIMAEQFARHVDFFSVGTNDLTQYTMAIDRGHPKLAAIADGLNPAVLNLISQAADAAHKYGKVIGVCGGLASDPQAVPLLIGAGVDELSVSVPMIPAVKAQIRSLNLMTCKKLTKEALALDTAKEVRELVPYMGNK